MLNYTIFRILAHYAKRDRGQCNLISTITTSSSSFCHVRHHTNPWWSIRHLISFLSWVKILHKNKLPRFINHNQLYTNMYVFCIKKIIFAKQLNENINFARTIFEYKNIFFMIMKVTYLCVEYLEVLKNTNFSHLCRIGKWW